MTLQLGGDGAITGCTSLENPDLIASGLTTSGSVDAEKVLVASGTAAAPSYTFSGDTDNGLYYAGTNSIGLATAGTNAILIDSSNRVGIGTASPSSVLHIKANTDATTLPSIILEDSGTASTRLSSISNVTGDLRLAATASLTDLRSYIYLQDDRQIIFGRSNSEAARIDTSGRLLVGTSTATNNVYVNESLALVRVGTGYGGASFTSYSGTTPAHSSFLVFSRSRGTADGTFTEVVADDALGNLVFRGADGTGWSEAARIQCFADGDWTTSGDTTDSPGRLVFSTTADGSSSPTERLRIDSSGNVGIGASPVNSTNYVNLALSDTNGGLITFMQGATQSADIIGGSGLFLRTLDASPITFRTNGSNERMRIDSSGNVGIGTTSPRGLLHVGPDLASGATDAARINLKQNGLAATDGIYLERSGERRGYHMFIGGPNDGLTFRANNFGTFTTTMYLNREGNVGIGTTGPAAKLDVNGNQTSNVVAMAALNVDCSAGNYFTKTINGNSTFTFSNVPSSRSFSFVLELTHTSGTVTWPASVKFPDDTAPTLTTGKTHLFVFETNDGGTRFRGAALVDYVN